MERWGTTVETQAGFTSRNVPTNAFQDALHFIWQTKSVLGEVNDALRDLLLLIE